ncbi:MAG TPA: hypothetical protein VFO12_02440 [Sphingomicrobium sp.]|nr:hypothetical protein [Sphingomicrobium sp.]
MMQFRCLLLLPVAALALSGCVAGMVAGAVGMAADGGGRGKPRNSEFMQAAARQACSAHASQYGTVQVVGVKQQDDGEIVVSGTVADASGRNSFDCSFVTEITGFSLQPVQPAT